MDVERTNAADIDALVQLRLAYLREDFGALEDSEAEAIAKRLADYLERHLNRDLFAYALREGEELVSCAFLLVVEKPMSPAFPNGRTGTVLNVYTCPAHRRRGCAMKVLQKLLAEAREMELSSVELKATADGYALYKAAGFADETTKYRPMKWKNL